MQKSNTNPLAKHFRQFRKYVQLPSADLDFVDNSNVVYDNDRKEIGVKPMTAADEILFKNPDALLNGEAVKEIIRSCVPAIKDPGLLLNSDVDYLLVAIKIVSYGEGHPVEAKCPKCGHAETYELNLEDILASVDTHDNAYPVKLESGLTVFLRPHIYNDTIKAMSVGFQEANVIESINGQNKLDGDEAQRIKKISESITKIANLNFNIVTNSILKVVDEELDINVTDRKHIEEFSRNMDRASSQKILNELNRINEIGLKDEFPATCTNEECRAEWNAMISYNPTTFFTQPS